MFKLKSTRSREAQQMVTAHNMPTTKKPVDHVLALLHDSAEFFLHKLKVFVGLRNITAWCFHPK